MATGTASNALCPALGAALSIALTRFRSVNSRIAVTAMRLAASMRLILGSFVSTAPAQWTVISPHPIGASESIAVGTDGVQQVGYINASSGQERAAVWSGTAASWVDLQPVGATRSRAFGVSTGPQAGFVIIGGAARASLWTGSGASWIDLSPTGATESAVLGIGDGQQAGVTNMGGQLRASLWSGTPESWIDLGPPGTESYAYGVGGGQQTGGVRLREWFSERSFVDGYRRLTH